MHAQCVCVCVPQATQEGIAVHQGTQTSDYRAIRGIWCIELEGMTLCGSCLAQCRLRQIQLLGQLAAQLVQGAELAQHHIPVWGFVIICGGEVGDTVTGGNLYPVCTAPFALYPS